MKAIPYIRVSSDDQANSLEVQQEVISRYAKANNIEIGEYLIDEDVSGGKPIYLRPAGSKLRMLLQPGMFVIAAKIDRLFRNTKDALITVDEWKEQDVAFILADGTGNSFNTKTAMGEFIFTNVVAFAQFERRITGERTKAILDHKKSIGKKYGKTPYGYDSVGGFYNDRKGKVVDQDLIINEYEQGIIQEIMIRHNNEVPSLKIANWLNEKGILTKNKKKWCAQTVINIINQQKLNKVA